MTQHRYRLRRAPAVWLAFTAVTAVTMAMLLQTPAAQAHPTPASVPYRWELNFEPGDLRLYVDDQDGERYWYLVYKVTNRSGRDQLWAPSMTMFTDEGEILRSGQDVPSHVTEDLLLLLGNPLLEEQNSIIGNILHGREHAKEGLAVWPARNLGVNEINIFVRGISGESTRVINPLNGERVTLYKTLELDYLISGNAVARGSQPIDLVSRAWIMR